MAGGKKKEKIMLNTSDLQIVITKYERKTKNTAKDVNGRFHVCVHSNICIHIYKAIINP